MTSSFVRPVGASLHEPLLRYKSFRYQAKSWTRPRRIIAKVEHHRGELFPRVGPFIVTSMVLPSRSVVRFYNKRWHGGAMDHWKASRPPTGRGCRSPRFRANEVRLQLSVLAYDLGNLWPDWSCRRGSIAPSRSRVSSSGPGENSGGRLVKHARSTIGSCWRTGT